MTLRVDVEPQVLEWARVRSGRDFDDLADDFPGLPEWLAGRRSPTLRQLEQYAAATRTPLGYLLLSEPPHEELPVPDFRTIRDEGVRQPSADLLDTIYLCQQRQDWYRDYARDRDLSLVEVVGSLTRDTSALDAARIMREQLGLSVEDRHRASSWGETRTAISERLEQLGILVMVSGIVGSNTHRSLDPDEFRGFSLADSRAPLIFVNGADTRAAQIFTLLHEAAHIWLGESGVDDPVLGRRPEDRDERWCNEVSAEILVPIESLRARYDGSPITPSLLDEFATYYRASTLVVLRRFRDTGFLTWEAFRSAYDVELSRVTRLAAERASDGGSFYNTQPVRVSKRFARAIISDTIEGRTRYTDAFRLLGSRKQSAFDSLGQRLGVA